MQGEHPQYVTPAYGEASLREPGLTEFRRSVKSTFLRLCWLVVVPWVALFAGPA